MNEIKVINQTVSLNPISLFAEQIEKGTAALKLNLEVDSQPKLETASDMLNRAKKLSGLVNKEVDTLCRPLKDYKKDIDVAQKKIKGYAEKLLLPLTEVTIKMEQNIISFHKKEQDRATSDRLTAEKAEAERIANQESNPANAEDVFSDPHYDLEDRVHSSKPVLEAPKVKGMTKVLNFNIINPEAVPRQYCSHDSVKIRKAINDGILDIPGVEIYEETKIRKV